MRLTFPGRTGPTRVAGSPSMNETVPDRLSARVSFTAVDYDHGLGCLDTAAGCEYVDDRIRLREPGERDWRYERQAHERVYETGPSVG
jgi:hypothetical protein